VDLVVDQVGELQDVRVAAGDRVVVRLAGSAVVEGGLAVGADQATVVAVVGADRLGLDVGEDGLDGRVTTGHVLLVPLGAVEHRGGDQGGGAGGRAGLGLGAAQRGLADVLVAVVPAPAGGPSEVRLEHLAHVHAGRDAERVQDDV